DGEETGNVQDEDKRLDLWQYLACMSIHEDCHSHDTPVHQCSLPQGWTIGWIIQLCKGDDHVAPKVGTTREDGLPAADDEPACSLPLVRQNRPR
ncbi:MAG: hypothetical protein Q9224_006404, partial [Gallowayella concinna]